MDRNMSILIVGGYQTTFPMIKDLLNQLGLNNVDKESDGAAALKKINETPYDLIISEWNIESMTGIDLLKQVRAAENKVLFMIIAEHFLAEDVLAAKEAGVDSLIVKPFNAGTFRDRLSKILGVATLKEFRTI
ncbi:MAG: response regulator [Alphaproteobacteria bacterium]|nr:response regulator [Alphaproteobacteria bacterium]